MNNNRNNSSSTIQMKTYQKEYRNPGLVTAEICKLVDNMTLDVKKNNVKKGAAERIASGMVSLFSQLNLIENWSRDDIDAVVQDMVPEMFYLISKFPRDKIDKFMIMVDSEGLYYKCCWLIDTALKNLRTEDVSDFKRNFDFDHLAEHLSQFDGEFAHYFLRWYHGLPPAPAVNTTTIGTTTGTTIGTTTGTTTTNTKPAKKQDNVKPSKNPDTVWGKGKRWADDVPDLSSSFEYPKESLWQVITYGNLFIDGKKPISIKQLETSSTFRFELETPSGTLAGMFMARGDQIARNGENFQITQDVIVFKTNFSLTVDMDAMVTAAPGTVILQHRDSPLEYQRKMDPVFQVDF